MIKVESLSGPLNGDDFSELALAIQVARCNQACWRSMNSPCCSKTWLFYMVSRLSLTCKAVQIEGGG